MPREAHWVGANAPGATFDGGDLHRIDLRNADLRTASFIGTNLRYARIDGVRFSNADRTGAVFNSNTLFAAATFEHHVPERVEQRHQRRDLHRPLIGGSWGRWASRVRPRAAAWPRSWDDPTVG